MNARLFCWSWIVACAVALSVHGSTVIYTTGFEASEGYSTNFTLADQRNWQVEGTGGNGIVEDFLPGMGQQAFIGYNPPTDTNDSTTVWTPVNFTPPSAQIVKFAVTLQLFKSEAGGDDEFRWAVYNQDAARLFAIDFLMNTQRIFFELENRQTFDTGYNFDVDGTYDLVVYMDFGRNQWTAFLNDLVIANAQPIRQNTTTALNLGDLDAVWFVNNLQSVGDNYMVFDNYTITAEDLTSIPGGLESIGMTPQRTYKFRVHGQIGVKYAIDITSDFFNWAQLYPGPGETFVNTEGTFIFEDTTAPNFSRGFYRLREVRP